MKKQSVFVSLIGLLILISVPTSGLAGTITNIDGGVAMISAGAGGMGFVCPWCAVGVGAFQLGWGIGMIVSDPPDTLNAGVPVNIDDLLVYSLPDIQTIYQTVPATLASSMDNYFDIMDSYVAYVRAYGQSLDREQGALLLGQPAWATARLAEAEAYRSQALTFAGQAVTSLPSLLGVMDTLYPNILSLPLTLSDLAAFRDQTKAGGLPSFEQFAISAWGISTTEQAALVSHLGGLSDGQLQDLFLVLDPVNGTTTTIGDALSRGTTFSADALAPEPSTGLLTILAIWSVFLVSNRRQRARTTDLK